MLNKRTLVLEGVTLGEVVELVVEMLVDLAAGTVLDEQSAKDAKTAHPQNLPVIPILSALQTQIQFSFSFSISLSSPLFRNLWHSPDQRQRGLGPVQNHRSLSSFSWTVPSRSSVWVYVRGHTGISGTLPLTEAAVSANAAGEVQLTGAGARVHGDGLLDDEAIGNELADGLAGVGIADLADLIGIEPDLSLADAEDRGGQALLGGEIDPREAFQLAKRALSRGSGQQEVSWRMPPSQSQA